MKLTHLAFLVLAVPCSATPAAAQARNPNIVFILADDFGYADLRCYGHPYARTPNLDKLAAEGTRFTQFYMTGITCCPSRTGLMTGKFPATFREYPAAAGFGKQVTVTELLKTQGYVTGHFGKWHIGSKETPGTYGLDSIKVTDGGGANGKRLDDRGRDASIFDDAIAFIEKNKEGPFYVNVWGHITHFPVNPPQAWVDRFQDVSVKEADFSQYMQAKFEQVRKTGGDVNAAMRRYLADVGSMDECVGSLLKTLDSLGLRDNTIVVFSSDQGPAPVTPPRKTDALPTAKKQMRMEQQWNLLGYAGEFRGGKHGMYEGGVRVPFIIRWPGHIPAGHVNTASVIGGIDWLPTLLLTGAKVDPGAVDGEDVSSVWLGKDLTRTRPLFWKTNAVRSDIAIREDQWKLFYPTRNRGQTELYDLSVDPGESTNVAAKHPEVVKQLTAKVEKWKATLPKDYVKSSDPD